MRTTLGKLHHDTIAVPALLPERALIYAIIKVAREDACWGQSQRHRDDAIQYFVGDIYRHHMTLLGLDEDLLPRGVGDLFLSPISSKNARK